MTDNPVFSGSLVNGEVFGNENPELTASTLRQEAPPRVEKFPGFRIKPVTLFLLVCFQIAICVAVAIAVYFLLGIGSSSSPNNRPDVFVKVTVNTTPSTLQEILPFETTTLQPMDTSTTPVVESVSHSDEKYENCDDVCSDLKSGRLGSHPAGFANQGTNVTIYPEAFEGEAIEVYCQCSIDGAWTVFQRRIDGTVDFNRSWAEYSNGFGDAKGDFWLGLEALNKFTLDKPAVLRVDLKNWKSETVFAKYRSFTISREITGYFMATGGYEGTAGDSLVIHNGIAFDTYDRLNRRNGPYSCASQFGGGWWYTNCAASTLNGQYGQKIFWSSWRSSGLIIEAEMKIRLA